MSRVMRARLALTAFFLLLGIGALWDAHDTLAAEKVTVKGVALLDWSHTADLGTLGVTEFYGWGEFCGARSNCTNMVRNWDKLPNACYPTLLLGNEPTNLEPAGHPIAASIAASVTVMIEQACPGTQIVAANIHIANYDYGTGIAGADAPVWLADFYATYHALAGHNYGGHNLIGLHCYQYAAACADLLHVIEALPGYSGHYWITETGFPDYIDNGPAEWRALLLAYQLDTRIDRVYAWTNRCQCYDGMDMVNADGALTRYGQAFRDWQPVSYQIYAPSVSVGARQGYP